MDEIQKPGGVVDEIEVVNVPHSDHMAVTVRVPGGHSNFTLDCPQAAALITVLLTRLMERQTPEVLQLLQTFAIRDIKAGQTDEGVSFLQYQLENGLAFGTRITPAEVATLHASLAAMLVN